MRLCEWGAPVRNRGVFFRVSYEPRAFRSRACLHGRRTLLLKACGDSRDECLLRRHELAWLGAYTGGKAALRVLARAQGPAPEGMRRQPR